MATSEMSEQPRTSFVEGNNQPPTRNILEDVKIVDELNLEVEQWIAATSYMSCKVAHDFVPESNHIGNYNSNHSFPCNITEFKPMSAGYIVEVFPPYKFYVFKGESNNSLFVSMATLRFIIKKKGTYVDEVCLDCGDQEKDEAFLITCLKKTDIIFTVDPYLGILINKCKWEDIATISRFPLPFDLNISGGGYGYICKLSMKQHQNTQNIDYQESTDLYIQQIALSYGNCDITKCVPVSVGVIDTGSIPQVEFTKFESEVVVHEKMYDTTLPAAQYCDYYDNGYPAHNITFHGTAVVEILKRSLNPKAKIYVTNVVANNGDSISCARVRKAFEEYQRLGVNIINCSFGGVWGNRKFDAHLKSLQAAGLIIIAAAGNIDDPITSDLNNGETIMVGSHGHSNVVSEFSSGKCDANVLALGEKFFLNHPTPGIVDGTSFATPCVTAVVANYMSAHYVIDHSSLKKHLNSTARSIKCSCESKNHNKCLVKKKMDTQRFMTSIAISNINVECSESEDRFERRRDATNNDLDDGCCTVSTKRRKIN